MSYRDDREALRQQLDELRREVEDLRAASGDDKAVAERIATLTTEVKSALERMDEDRDVLQKLATSLRSLKRDIGDESKEDAKPDDVKPPVGADGSLATNTWVKPTIVMVLCLIVVGAVWSALGPSKSVRPPVPDPLAGIAGAPKAVDALALLETARSRVPSQCLLESIDAWYVSEDGTLDLTAKAYGARVKYTFVAPEAPPPPADSSLPLGAPKPTQLRAPPASGCFELRADGFIDCGEKTNGLFIHPLHSATVPMPKCSAREVWTAAKSAGAPSGAVAHLVYSHQVFKKHPSWTFTIEGTSHSYEVSDPECVISKKNGVF